MKKKIVKNRYVNSFFITLVLYMSAIGGIIYETSSDNYSDKKTLNEKSSRICFSVITPESPIKKDEPKEEKKPKKKIVKKVEKKVEKKIEKQEIAQAIKKPIQEEIEQEQEEQTDTVADANPNVQKVVNTNVEKVVDEELIKAKQDRFIAHLVERINSNKSYPNAARRRAVEGDVKVEFHVFSDGSVNYIKMLSGKEIFKESTLEAIAKSFPIDVDKSLFSFPKEFRITIAYVLK